MVAPEEIESGTDTADKGTGAGVARVGAEDFVKESGVCVARKSGHGKGGNGRETHGRKKSDWGRVKESEEGRRTRKTMVGGWTRDLHKYLLFYIV